MLAQCNRIVRHSKKSQVKSSQKERVVVFLGSYPSENRKKKKLKKKALMFLNEVKLWYDVPGRQTTTDRLKERKRPCSDNQQVGKQMMSIFKTL